MSVINDDSGVLAQRGIENRVFSQTLFQIYSVIRLCSIILMIIMDLVLYYVHFHVF